jgi:ABC-type lipoprotein export system ATPase subunit
LQQGLENEVSQKLVSDLAIKTPSVKQFVRNLSGGNQQKVVLAKWLFADMDVLICKFVFGKHSHQNVEVSIKQNPKISTRYSEEYRLIRSSMKSFSTSPRGNPSRAVLDIT